MELMVPRLFPQQWQMWEPMALLPSQIQDCCNYIRTFRRIIPHHRHCQFGNGIHRHQSGAGCSWACDRFKWEVRASKSHSLVFRRCYQSAAGRAHSLLPKRQHWSGTKCSGIQMKTTVSGDDISEGEWTKEDVPYFSWDAGLDSQSDLKGYCLYLGTDADADPATAKGILGTSPVSTEGMDCQFLIAQTNIDFATSAYQGNTWLQSSSDLYYFLVKAIDNEGNSYDLGNATSSHSNMMELPQQILAEFPLHRVFKIPSKLSSSIGPLPGRPGLRMKIQV